MATTTPNYGWDVPTSTDYVKDGATAIETLGDDIDATLYTINNGSSKVGLHYITSAALTGGSVTITSAFNTGLTDLASTKANAVYVCTKTQSDIKLFVHGRVLYYLASTLKAISLQL
jgi:hypothetical protein